MKKKILLSLLVITFIFAITGCGKVEDIVETDDEVTVNGTIYKFNIDESGYDIKYKTASNITKVNTGNSIDLYGGTSGSADFIIRILNMKISLDFAIQSSGTYESKTEEKINGITYTKVYYNNNNGLNTYSFYYENNNNLYVFSFITTQEEKKLEELFLSQVNFEG